MQLAGVVAQLADLLCHLGSHARSKGRAGQEPLLALLDGLLQTGRRSGCHSTFQWSPDAGSAAVTRWNRPRCLNLQPCLAQLVPFTGNLFALQSTRCCMWHQILRCEAAAVHHIGRQVLVGAWSGLGIWSRLCASASTCNASYCRCCVAPLVCMGHSLDAANVLLGHIAATNYLGACQGCQDLTEPAGHLM